MTPQQRAVLDFVEHYIRQHRIAPTVREIQRHVGVSSPGTAHSALNRLIAQGFLVRTAGSTYRNLALPIVNLQAATTAALIAELQRRDSGHG